MAVAEQPPENPPPSAVGAPSGEDPHIGMARELEDALADARRDLEVLEALLKEKPGPSIQEAALRKAGEVRAALMRIQGVQDKAKRESTADGRSGVPSPPHSGPVVPPGQSAGGSSGRGPGSPGDATVPPQMPPPQAVAARELQGIFQALKSRTSSEERLKTLKERAQAAWFTCEQVRTLLPLFSTGREKIEALVVLHPRLTDRQHLSSLEELVGSEEERRELRQKLGLPQDPP